MTPGSALLAILMMAQLPPSPDLKPLPVAGVVVDASDRPIANADVWLAEAVPPDEGRRFGMELWYSYLTGPGEGALPVVVHARSDSAGRFTLAVPAEAVARRSPPPLAVWAASGQGQATRVAVRRLPRIVLTDDPPVRIELGPPAHAELIVLTPDRKPAAGARVVPTRTGDVPIPEPLGRLLAASADADGRAVIPGLDATMLDEIQVETKGFGTQILEIPDSRRDDSKSQDATTRKTTVVLAPVGRVAGRLIAANKEPIRGVTVRATSQVDGYIGSGIRGTATAACDEQGRFTIPAIAAGTLALELEFDPAMDCPLRGEVPRGLVVKAGQVAEVAIPLRETIAVRGLVREKGTKRPIAGVKVVLNGFFGGDRFATAGTDGRFAGRILRDKNQPYGWPLRFPAPFYVPADMTYPSQEMPRRGVAELELSPLELRRGVDVRGTVAGEDGQPVAGALVEAIWYTAERQPQTALVRTDRAGGFVLHGIDPIAELHLTAWDGFAGSAAVTVRAAATEQRPIALTVSPKHTIPIGGRVVDAAGQPIAGASVRLRRQVRARNDRVVVDDMVAATDGSFVLHTGADGRFRTRGRYPSRGEYHAEATAPGRLTARSTAVAIASDSNKPAVLVLHCVQAVEGRVVDRRGQPIAGAVVRQSGDGPIPTETSTAADGRFRLPGVIEGSGVILVEKAGFRPTVQPADGSSKPVEIVLARTDERPAVAYRTILPALPVEEETALARRLIEPLAAKVLARGDDVAKYRFLSDAATIDPHATIEWLDEAKFGDLDYTGSLRQVLATALAGESFDDATAILEAGANANARAIGYLGFVDTAPNLTIERKRALLDQAILNYKNVTPLETRIHGLGLIADRLIDLGDFERARTVLREGLELARGTGKNDKSTGYFPTYFVVALSRLDLPAALKLIEDLALDARQNEPGNPLWVYEREYVRIARKLADRSPAEAERILARASIQRILDHEIVGVCYQMTPRDIVRARRIATSRFSPESPTLGPYTLGLMARAVAPADRAEAVRLLDEAFAELGSLAQSESEHHEPAASAVAAALLPAVEQVEPDRLAEFLGRAVLMRRPRGDQTASGESGLGRSTSGLAMLVSRYDRGLAARILQPELDKIGSSHATFGRDYVTANALAALALIDPRRAVAMVEALPDDAAPGTDPNAVKGQARRSVAKLLALHGDDRWRDVIINFLWLWTPDQPFY